jgi:CheY-like chemotaxis protein
MDSVIAIELIKIIPSMLGFILAIILLIIFYKPIRYELFPRIGSVKAFGIEASFVEKIKSDVEKIGEKRKINISRTVSFIVAQRAGRLAPLVKGRRILWVDDNPQNNNLEINILESLGIVVYQASTSDEAFRLLKESKYDLIISDIMRDNVQDEGIRFLKRLIDNKLNYNVIFFAANIDFNRGTPPHAFGITNRFDELLHLVFDVLERKNLSESMNCIFNE